VEERLKVIELLFKTRTRSSLIRRYELVNKLRAYLYNTNNSRANNTLKRLK